MTNNEVLIIASSKVSGGERERAVKEVSVKKKKEREREKKIKAFYVHTGIFM